MHGHIYIAKRGRRLLLIAAALLGTLLLSCASASATMMQTVAFTSSAPSAALAGGSYEVSATTSSGLPVFIDAQGACSLSKPKADEDETLKPAIVEEQPPASGKSPATVYFIAEGTCHIGASGVGEGEYEASPEISQSFPVAKDPSEQITFISSAPSEATVGGYYDPTVQLSAGIKVSFLTTTPSVCTVAPEAVRFVRVGTCTIGVRQEAVSESPPGAQQQSSEPPEAEQSFTVHTPIELIGKPSVNHKSAAIKLKTSLGGSGELSWVLTCKLASGATRPFGEGSETVTGAATPTVTVKPSAGALKALRRARKHGHGLSVEVALTFDPSSGGSPTSLERSIVVRLK